MICYLGLRESARPTLHWFFDKAAETSVIDQGPVGRPSASARSPLPQHPNLKFFYDRDNQRSTCVRVCSTLPHNATTEFPR